MTLRVAFVSVDNHVAFFKLIRVKGDNVTPCIFNESINVYNAIFEFLREERRGVCADLCDRLNAAFRAVVHCNTDERCGIIRKAAHLHRDIPRRTEVIALKIAHDLLHIVLRLRIGGDSTVLLHSTRARIVRGNYFLHITAECIHQLTQVLCAAVDVSSEIGRVNAEPFRRFGHELHDADCASL